MAARRSPSSTSKRPPPPAPRGAEAELHRAFVNGAWLSLYPRFVAEHQELMARLQETLPLRQEELLLFGQSKPTPRLTSWHGDPGCVYTYSGREFTPEPWTTELERLRDYLKWRTGHSFNSVLVNFYRNEKDSMGAHSDDEAELGPSEDNIVIASVSLGQKRRFVLESKANKSQKIDYQLGEGNLLVMGGTTQRFFRHSLPKTRKATGARMNLTFRWIHPRKERGKGAAPVAT